MTNERTVKGVEPAARIGGTSADLDDRILPLTRNVIDEATIHGVLASLGVTPTSVHKGETLAVGSLGRATHVRRITPDSASLRTVVGERPSAEDPIASGEGGSRSNREARIHLNRGPGKQQDEGEPENEPTPRKLVDRVRRRKRRVPGIDLDRRRRSRKENLAKRRIEGHR